MTLRTTGVGSDMCTQQARRVVFQLHARIKDAAAVALRLRLNRSAVVASVRSPPLNTSGALTAIFAAVIIQNSDST